MPCESVPTIHGVCGGWLPHRIPSFLRVLAELTASVFGIRIFAASSSTFAGRSERDPHRSRVNSEIERLLEEQKQVKQQKKDLTKELRNAQRRRQRLKHKARLLSQVDLLEVMNLRSDEEASKRARTEGEVEELAAPGSGSTEHGEAELPAEDQFVAAQAEQLDA